MDEQENEGIEGQRVEAHIQALAQENNDRLQQLAAQGALPSEAQLLKVRLDVLTDFTVGPAVRLALEAHYQQVMSQFIDWVESEANKSKLTQGVTASVADSIRNMQQG
jgi:hypothetical protein